MTTVGSGPWSSYEAFFQDRVKLALHESRDNTYINGWKANGIQERLEKFLESGIAAQFQSFESEHDRAIVHADFSKCYLLLCYVYIIKLIASINA
jgi:hypothetical protein